jgi:hypothetical protein
MKRPHEFLHIEYGANTTYYYNGKVCFKCYWFFDFVVISYFY